MLLVMTSLILLLPVVVLSLLATSCQKPAVYLVKGVVREIMADKKTLKIAHEKIPGYMEAMTMDFSVTNSAELNGLKPGDDIAFRMTVTRASLQLLSTKFPEPSGQQSSTT